MAVGGDRERRARAEDQEGRRDGGPHARGRPGRGRGRGLPRDLRTVPPPHRDRRAAARPGQVRARRRVVALPGDELSPLETLRERLARAVSIHLGRRRTRGRRSRRCGTCSPSTRATGRSCSNSRWRTTTRRLRVQADVTSQIRVQPLRPARLGRRAACAAPARSCCNRRERPWLTSSTSKNRSASCRRRSRRCRMLPLDADRQRDIARLRGPHPGDPAGALRARSRRGSACWWPAIRRGPRRSTTSSSSSPTSSRSAATAASPTTTRSWPGSAAFHGAAGDGRRPPEGQRHQAEDLPELRLRAARGLPEGAARDAAGREVRPARRRASSTRRRPIPASSPRNAASPRRSPSTCARWRCSTCRSSSSCTARAAAAARSASRSATAS